MKRALLLLLLAGATIPGAAQTNCDANAKQSAQVFLTMCETSDKVVRNVCVAYTKGFVEGAQLAIVYQSTYDQTRLTGGVCVPDSLNYVDVLDGFLLFLRAHPEKQRVPGGAAMLEYLTSNYQCRAGEASPSTVQ